MSGHVATTPIASPTTSRPRQTTALIAIAPSSKPSYPRCQPIPHVRHVSRLREPAVEEGAAPAAPGAAPPHAPPQHRRQRGPRHGRTIRPAIRETRTNASRPGGRALLRRRNLPRRRRRRLVAAARRVRHRPERRSRRRRARRPGHPRRDRQRSPPRPPRRRSACRSPTCRRKSTSWPRPAPGAALMREIVADSHATLIGARPGPVQITGAQLVELTRDRAVGDLPPVTLPVEEVAVLSTIRTSLDWAVPIAAIAGVAFLLLGLLAHPRKSDAVFGIGMFCIIAGVAVVLIGYVVPGVPRSRCSTTTCGRRHPRRRRGRPADRAHRRGRAAAPAGWP